MCASRDAQEETSIFYDAKEKLLKVDTRRSEPEDTPKAVEAGPFELKDGEPLKLRVFVDKPWSKSSPITARPSCGASILRDLTA